MMETTPNQKKLGVIGRIMMNAAATEKDDAKSNHLAVVGDKLTRFGAAWGTRKTDFSKEDLQLIVEYMKEA